MRQPKKQVVPSPHHLTSIDDNEVDDCKSLKSFSATSFVASAVSQTSLDCLISCLAEPLCRKLMQQKVWRTWGEAQGLPAPRSVPLSATNSGKWSVASQPRSVRRKSRKELQSSFSFGLCSRVPKRCFVTLLWRRLHSRSAPGRF